MQLSKNITTQLESRLESIVNHPHKKAPFDLSEDSEYAVITFRRKPSPTFATPGNIKTKVLVVSNDLKFRTLYPFSGNAIIMMELKRNHA